MLLDKGQSVRAMVHREDARAQRLRDLGAEVVVGDLTNPKNVVDAMPCCTGTWPTLPPAMLVAEPLVPPLPPLVHCIVPSPKIKQPLFCILMPELVRMLYWPLPDPVKVPLEAVS